MKLFYIDSCIYINLWNKEGNEALGIPYWKIALDFFNKYSCSKIYFSGFILKELKEGVSVITVGQLANEITKKLQTQNVFSKNFENNSTTSRYILDNIEIGTTIVLKASRAMKFEEIVEQVKKK